MVLILWKAYFTKVVCIFERVQNKKQIKIKTPATKHNRKKKKNHTMQSNPKACRLLNVHSTLGISVC